MARTTAPALEALELLSIDPATLTVDDQVRADATPDEGLIASVRRHGVLQPPTVYWDEDRGQHVVVMGHRRVGAAIAAQLPTIQVLVRSAEDARDALRTEQQLVENERREQLTPADIARGYKDLNLFGLRPEDIAAAVAEKPARVKAALKAVKSEAATAALAEGLDLEQAAKIAEFDDAPELQQNLTTIALDTPADFERQYLLATKRAKAAEIETQLTAQLETEGVSLLGVHPYAEGMYWSGNGDTIKYGAGRTLLRLDIDPDDHKTCPGHAAIIHCANNPDDIAILYVCTDSKTHHSDDEQTAELTPEQIEQQQEWERRRAEQAALREALAANTTARRDWLRGFITGRLNQTPGMFDLIADASIGAARYDQIEPHDDNDIAVYILTGETIHETYPYTALADLLDTGRFTALRALAADALASCESRSETPELAASSPRVVVKYFTHLSNWGYELTELDQEIQTAAAEQLAYENEDTDGDPDEES